MNTDRPVLIDPRWLLLRRAVSWVPTTLAGPRQAVVTTFDANRLYLVLCVLFALATAGCGARLPSVSSAPAHSRMSPIASSVRNVPGCHLLMRYHSGTVFLDFATPQTDCATIGKDLAAAGPPFNGALTPIGSINIAAPFPICYKSDFRLNGVLIAEVLSVLVNRGAPDLTAAAFCAEWIGAPNQGA